MTESHVILYDGVCRLCNRLNRFVIRRDREDRFRFASLQSRFAAETLSRYEKDPRDLDTLYVITQFGAQSESLLSRSEAVLFILREIGGGWRLFGILSILPTSLLNLGYDLVAGSRYQIFGRYDSCPMPRAEHRDKFIDVESPTPGPSSDKKSWRKPA